MPTLAVSSTEDAVSQLARAEIADDEAARRFDVERLAREEIDVSGPIVRKGVAARVTLRQEHHSCDGERAIELVLGDERRPDGGQTELRRKIDKRFTNAGTVEPSWIAAERIRNPMKSEHGFED